MCALFVCHEHLLRRVVRIPVERAVNDGVRIRLRSADEVFKFFWPIASWTNRCYVLGASDVHVQFRRDDVRFCTESLLIASPRYDVCERTSGSVLFSIKRL